MSEAVTPPIVAICVVSFQRPVGLARLLHALAALETGCPVSLEVIVVDNDIAGSARTVLDDFRPQAPWPLRYARQPAQGIPHARNVAVTEAWHADFIAFMDDDEAPLPQWLDLLLEGQEKTGADVVLGPSRPQFEPDAPSWVVEGGFFDRVHFPSGSLISYHYARTSGVLIARASLPSATPFDERLRYSGGSDHQLFERMARAGRRFAWIDEAVVEEFVPTTRANARWLIARSFRTGVTQSLAMVTAAPAGGWRRFRRAGRGAKEMGLGSIAVVRAIGADQIARTRARQRVATGLGLVAGVVGIRYNEYLKVVHGQ